jgi:hypothetical protein
MGTQGSLIFGRRYPTSHSKSSLVQAHGEVSFLTERKKELYFYWLYNFFVITSVSVLQQTIGSQLFSIIIHPLAYFTFIIVY